MLWVSGLGVQGLAYTANRKWKFTYKVGIFCAFEGDCHVGAKNSDRGICIVELYGGCLKLEVPFWGVPIVRIIVDWGLYTGPPI